MVFNLVICFLVTIRPCSNSLATYIILVSSGFWIVHMIKEILACTCLLTFRQARVERQKRQRALMSVSVSLVYLDNDISVHRYFQRPAIRMRATRHASIVIRPDIGTRE